MLDNKNSLKCNLCTSPIGIPKLLDCPHLFCDYCTYHLRKPHPDTYAVGVQCPKCGTFTPEKEMQGFIMLGNQFDDGSSKDPFCKEFSVLKLEDPSCEELKPKETRCKGSKEEKPKEQKPEDTCEDSKECCETCKKKIGDFICVKCNTLFCETCKDDPPLFQKSLCSHEILSVSKVQKGDRTEGILCAKHRSFPVAYCCNDCGKFGCVECMANEHSGHDVVEVENAYRDLKASTKKFLIIIKHQKSSAKMFQRRMKNLKKLYKFQCDEILKELLHEKNELLKKVEADYSKLINEAHDEVQSNLEVLNYAKCKLVKVAKAKDCLLHEGRRAIKKEKGLQILDEFSTGIHGRLQRSAQKDVAKCMDVTLHWMTFKPRICVSNIIGKICVKVGPRLSADR